MKTNIIYNEDCIKGMRKLPNKCVDLIVTDPPYHFEGGGGGFLTKTNKKYLKKIEDSFGHKFEPEFK